MSDQLPSDLPNQHLRVVRGEEQTIREQLSEHLAEHDPTIRNLEGQQNLEKFYGRVEKSLGIMRERSQG